MVRAEAEARLQALVAPLADESTPPNGARDAWRRWWTEATSREPEPRAAVVASEVFDLARVTASQTWPELSAAVDGSIALGLSRLLTPIDGFTDGVAVVPPRATSRRWAFTAGGPGREPTGLDVASGPQGLGVLLARGDDWHVAVLPSAPRDRAAPRAEPVAPGASHATVAASETGFALPYGVDGGEDVFAVHLDLAGKVAGRTRAIRPLDRPATRYHHGIHPFALARTPRGWLAAVETESRVVSMALSETAANRVVNEVSAHSR